MKGQTAVEYLMTYGWSLMIILIIAGVLSYYEIFSPKGFIITESKTSFEICHDLEKDNHLECDYNYDGNCECYYLYDCNEIDNHTICKRSKDPTIFKIIEIER